MLLSELIFLCILSIGISAARERRDLKETLSDLGRQISDLDDSGKFCSPYAVISMGKISTNDTCGPVSYCNSEGIPSCQYRWWFIAAIVAAVVLVISLIACACRGCMA